MTEGRVVDLQRDIVAGLLTRALPPRTDFRPVIVGAEMDAEVRGVLGVGIVRRYEHHFGIDGKGANAPRIAALGAAELTDRSEEHTSELQSLMRISYAVFCLKK